MKRSELFVIVVCLATLACTEDPARSVKIVSRPAEPARAIAAPPPALVPDQPRPVRNVAAPSSAAPAKDIARPARPAPAVSSVEPGSFPDVCPPPADASAGPSDFVVKGPCGFEHRAAVICEPMKDDFYVAITRKAKNGATLVAFLNVERYHGPGNYDLSQMFVTVQSGTANYRWSSDNVHATVGPGEAFVTLPETRLEEEPMLVGCTGLIGPATNYQYNCRGRAAARAATDITAEVVSGKLQCAERPKE